MAFIHKHTPGKWKVINGLDKNGKWNLFPSVLFFGDKKQFQESMGRSGVTINSSHDQDPVSLTANAKLIAAAPELLQFAEMLHDHWASRKEEPFLLTQLKQTLLDAGVEITH